MQQTTVMQRQIISIGRGPENDQVLDFPMISWRHARLIVETSGQIFVEDLQSSNGVGLHSPSARVQRAEVRLGDVLYFGSYGILVDKLVTGQKLQLGEGAAVQRVLSLDKGAMTIGRDPAADIVVDHPGVSWHHAKIERDGTDVFVTDLGSLNGTWIDGVAVKGRKKLLPGQEVSLGHYRFSLREDGAISQKDYKGNYSIEAEGVVVTVGKGRRLLNPISFSIYPQELVALMGPAGAGKTTLLKALNGYTPLLPGQGRVLFNGSDLNTEYRNLRQVLGYVPQDDIMHAQLTVREALRYTAKLRTDLREEEISRRIETVLNDLGVADIIDREIGSPEKKVLSGGQRKRVNVAMELMSDPDVIFLDEPTSGLSSYDAEQVIFLLRRLADNGKTIVATIHQPSLEIYKRFDNLLMVARDKGDNPGVLAYYGQAYPQSIEFLNPEAAQRAKVEDRELSPEMLLTGLSRHPSQSWGDRYEGSTQRKQFVLDRAGKNPASISGAPAKPKRTWGFRQWWPLVSRNLTLKRRDTMQAFLMVAQPVLFAVMLAASFRPESRTVYESTAEWAKFASRLGTIHFLMVVAVIWFGCNNAARDIVGEITVYTRERMVSLKLPSYVFSKLAVLALLCFLQCAILLAIVYPACGLASPLLPLFLILFVASMTGASIGLLISATTQTTEAAIMLLPIVLLPMIIFGGGIKPVHEMKPMDRLAQIVPSRWAFEATFVQEAKHRKETLIPKDCDAALDEQRKACNAILAKFPGRTSIPAATAKESDRDVAEAAFPKQNVRHSLDRILGTLLAMTTLMIGLVLGILRSRDVR